MLRPVTIKIFKRRMNHNQPLVILEDQPEEIHQIKQAFDFLKLEHPLYFFTSSAELDQFLKEEYAVHTGKERKPLPAFFLSNNIVGGEPVIETLKRLKTHPVFCTVPVVIFAAATDSEDVSACYANGCAGYFLKPERYDGYHKVLEVIYQFWDATAAEQRTGIRRSRYMKTP